MGVVSLIDHMEGAAVPGQAGDGGVVKVGQLMPALRLHTLYLAQELTDGGTVAEQSYVLVRMLLGNGANGLIDPLTQRPQIFPITGGPEGGIGVVEKGELFALEVTYFSPGSILPVSHVDLPKAGMQMEGKLFGNTDGPGGQLCADKIAGVGRVDGN